MSELDDLLREMRVAPVLSKAFERAPNAPTQLLARLQTPRRHYLTKAEICEIALVKLKGVAGSKTTRKNIDANTDELVLQATTAALLTDDAKTAIDELLRLRGIGVAVASSVLSWCKPERWSVIDRRACATLVQFDLMTKRNQLRTGDYVRYDEVTSRLARTLEWSPQRVDRWLYAFDKCHLAPGDCLR